MRVRLAINTGFAVNRFTAPEQWIPFIRDELGVVRVQFTADMLMPFLLDPLAERISLRTRRIADQCGLCIESTFTGAFTRLNHFSHPDPEVRAYWLTWFKRFADISVLLGAQSMGSHLGIQTLPDYASPQRRAELLEKTIDGWRDLAEYAGRAGLAYLSWEPMSIPREYGETLTAAGQIQSSFDGFSLPVYMCLDVDHGDTASQYLADTDPYTWAECFGKVAPLIHMKQSLVDKGGHWPFTAANNLRGRIRPGDIVDALRRGEASDVTFVLELSFRERTLTEKQMVSDLRESVAFLRPFCTE